MADSTHGLTQTWLLDSTGLFADSQFCCGVLSHISVTSTSCMFGQTHRTPLPPKKKLFLILGYL